MAQNTGGPFLTGQLPCLYAVTQPSKIIEGLNLHWFRSLRNSDNKGLVLISLHFLMDVREMNEVMFRYQGIFALVFMVDCNRPSCAHRNFPKITRRSIAGKD